MAEITTLREAVAKLIGDGDYVACEGFTHLIPFAAGHEIIRQEKRNLALVRMTPDIIHDQMIGMGCARELTFSWGGNPGVGSLHRFRDAIENNWPAPLKLNERSHADLANAYAAGASGLPFAVMRGYVGNDLPKHNPQIKALVCPFTGETLAAVPSVRPDVAVVHAQKADRKGNVLIYGIVGVQKEAVLAAKRSIVTVEEIVASLDAPRNATILPNWVVSAVCCVPRGARPSYAEGYYGRDNKFYSDWDEIARERESFLAWMKRHVMSTVDFADYERSLGGARAQQVSHG